VNRLQGKTDFVTGWGSNGATATVTPGQSDPLGGTKAFRIQTVGGSFSTKYYAEVDTPSVAGRKYATSLWLMVPVGKPAVTLADNIGNTQTVAATGGWTKAAIVGTGDGAITMRMGFVAGIADNLDFYAWRPLVEERAYHTPYTATSRPAVYNSGALLIEEQAQNLMPYSDPTSTANFWSVDGGLSIASGVSPFLAGGIQFPDDKSVDRQAYESVTLQPSTAYTISAVVRMNDGGVPKVTTNTDPTGDFTFVVAGFLTYQNPIVSSFGGGIYRVSATVTLPASGLLVATGVKKYTGQTARGFKASGFQLEQRAYPTSYIPTAGAAVTRQGETFQIPTAGILSPTQGAVEFWAYIDAVARRQVSGQFPGMFRIHKPVGAGIVLVHAASSGNWYVATYNDADAETATTFASDVYTPDGWHHFAVAWNSSLVSLAIDGVVRATKANPNLPTSFGASMQVGYQGGAFLNSKIADLRLSSVARSEADIAALVASGMPAPVDQYTTYKQDFRRRSRTLAM
jgi:hypothetical protein